MDAAEASSKGRKFRGLDAEQRQAERRARLIDAGLETFGRQGFQSTTVKDVCTEAKLTERYFYESFARREELFSAVYEHCVTHLREQLVRALSLDSRDPAAMTQSALRMLYTALRDDPRLARVLFIDALTAHGDMDKHSIRALEGFSDLLRGYVLVLFPTLPRLRLDATLIATGLVGAVVLLVTRWTLTGFRESIDDMVRNTSVLFEALAAHVSIPTADR
ncbi:MAG TPA: TetR/AcrR family transcriptional regulator [Solimonas sp.]